SLVHAVPPRVTSLLSLHDALPICKILIVPGYAGSGPAHWQSWLQNRLPDSERVTGIDWHDPILPRWSERIGRTLEAAPAPVWIIDRKSTRLNSSHVKISYAVFCLK